MSEQRTFTDAFIASLKPKAKPYKRSEYAPKGEGRLTVRVLPSVVREFFYRYRVNGQDRTLSLGRYGNGRALARDGAARTRARCGRLMPVSTLTKSGRTFPVDFEAKTGVCMTRAEVIAVLALLVSIVSVGFSIYFNIRDRGRLKVTSKFYEGRDGPPT